MPRVLANGINIHYWQTGQGPDIVLVHGFGANLASWQLAIVPALHDKYRVTTYDLRGHGRTDRPSTGYSTQAMADDLCGLLDSLGIEDSYLVGHSMGGDVALHFAVRYPRRAKSLVVLESVFPALAARYRRKDSNVWPVWAKLLEEATGHGVPLEKFGDLEYMALRMVEFPMAYGPRRSQTRDQESWTKLITETTVLADYQSITELTVENLGRITAPVLLLYEENSMFRESQQALQKNLPNATSIYLPPTRNRHFPHLEQPELIVSYVRRFLSAARDEDGLTFHDKL